jgi:2'-5' RNA ligase
MSIAVRDDQISVQLQLWDGAPPQHNVFFAVMPDATAAECIARMAQDLVGSRHIAAVPLPPERFHVSLFAIGGFSGTCPSTVINHAKAIAGTVLMSPFDVAFDRVASFGGRGGKRALVLLGGEGVAGLVRLQQTLSLAMLKAGVGMRQRSKFIPHLTMMYADKTSEFAVEPISWTVNAFILVDSLYGQSKHELLARWPL